MDTPLTLLAEAKEWLEGSECDLHDMGDTKNVAGIRKLIDRITAMLDSGKSAEAIVKNEALELAARECDQMAKRSERDLYGAVRSAAAIRKLKVE